MKKVLEYFKNGSVTLSEVDSKFNGKLSVKWSPEFGYHIMGGGLWQVGGPVATIWKYAISQINLKPQKILILGLGGGTIASIVRKNWVDTEIDGVDIDPVIIDLGNKYLGLKKHSVNQIVSDGFLFLEKSDAKYDLICLDTYQGDSFPEKFESKEFLALVRKSLNESGVCIVNRLYYGKHRGVANKFEKTLSDVFSEVEVHYPELAAMFICKK
jgi:spermidine synthase